MKKKILRVIFSIGAGFGLTILLFYGLVLLFLGVFKMDDEDGLALVALIMGILVFAVLSARIYDYLKRE